jgi:hypothetical protein
MRKQADSDPARQGFANMDLNFAASSSGMVFSSGRIV